MRFRWEAQGTDWRLTPDYKSRPDLVYAAPITVRRGANGLWTVCLGEREIYPGNYTSEDYAKADAWRFAQNNSLTFFGDRRIKLEGHNGIR